MEGSSHLMDHEILDYETTQIENDETDDTTDDEEASDNNIDDGQDPENNMNERELESNGTRLKYNHHFQNLSGGRLSQRTSTPTDFQNVSRGRIAPRTSTPTYFSNNTDNQRNSTRKVLYRGYNRAVEISDDDNEE